jgi:hypothetical protein
VTERDAGAILTRFSGKWVVKIRLGLYRLMIVFSGGFISASAIETPGYILKDFLTLKENESLVCPNFRVRFHNEIYHQNVATESHTRAVIRGIPKTFSVMTLAVQEHFRL